VLFLRSLIFFVGMAIFTVIFTTPTPIIVLLPYRWRYMILTQWSRVVLHWLRITCNLNFVVEGREHIPNGAAIVFCKHQSTWETLALQRVFPPQAWVLRRSLFMIPFFGWGLWAMDPVGIDRGAGRKALAEVVEGGTARLKKGRWVVVFPEGTRVPPGKRAQYRIGGAILATKSGFPVVPVAHNGGEYWPKKRGFLKPPGTIKMVIGPPLESTNVEPNELMHRAETWIEAQMERITAERYKTDGRITYYSRDNAARPS